MAMSKEQREEQSYRAWVDQNREGLMLIMQLQDKGYDVDPILDDAIKGELKGREHYRKGG